MIVCFTGHRPKHPSLGEYETKGNEKCYSVVGALHTISTRKAISGMALSFNQWSASACMKS